MLDHEGRSLPHADRTLSRVRQNPKSFLTASLLTLQRSQKQFARML